MDLEIILLKAQINLPLKQSDQIEFEVSDLGPPKFTISNIDQLGNLEIQFNQKMNFSFNLTDYDESVLEIKILRSDID